jgi:hypothetical protein
MPGTLAEVAIYLNELYLSLLAAGWSREDALDLIARMMTIAGKKHE